MVPAAPIPQPVLHIVEVGMQDQLLFSPDQVTAKTGDSIGFIFHQLNHTLKQSSLETPCNALPGGFDTGFTQSSLADDHRISVSFEVKDEQPKWFYCSQTVPISHCSAGMVFAINPGDQMNAFLDNARGIAPPSYLNSTTSPPPRLIVPSRTRPFTNTTIAHFPNSSTSASFTTTMNMTYTVSSPASVAVSQSGSNLNPGLESSPVQTSATTDTTLDSPVSRSDGDATTTTVDQAASTQSITTSVTTHSASVAPFLDFAFSNGVIRTGATQTSEAGCIIVSTVGIL